MTPHGVSWSCGRLYFVSFFFAMILRPFVALIVLGLICLPIRLLIQKFPDGKVKRFLLLPIGKRSANNR